MLYILPPPSAKPPSVWDLIINFHRKGCQESGSTSSPSNPKKSLKFDCRDTKKSQRTWCKTSPSDQSHVSERARGARRLYSWPQKRIGFTFSAMPKPDQTDGHEEKNEKISSRFSTQNKTWFSHFFFRRRRRDFCCCGKWNSFFAIAFSHMAKRFSSVAQI